MLFTNEEDFIKKLEAYLNTKFDKYSKSRIDFLLNEYKGKSIAVVKKVPSVTTKLKVITKYRVIDKGKLPLCTQEVLESEGLKICEKHNIPYQQFVQSVERKSPTYITDVRKEFCKLILTRYNSERKQLMDFFHVDHSSIVHYLQDERGSIFFKDAV